MYSKKEKSDRTITVRISQSDYAWLKNRALEESNWYSSSNISKIIRKLIREKRKE